MPIFRKKEPPPDPQQQAMLREYEANKEIMLEVRDYITQSYLLSLYQYYLKTNQQMPDEQMQSLLVGLITQVQNELPDKHRVIFKNHRLYYELRQLMYTRIELPDHPAFGDAKYREELHEKAFNPFSAKFAWRGAWLQILAKKAGLT